MQEGRSRGVGLVAGVGLVVLGLVVLGVHQVLQKLHELLRRPSTS